MAAIITSVFISQVIDVSPSQAGIILKERTKFYTVTGKTGKEIYHSMIKNGPDHGETNKDVLASTSFKFDFKNDVVLIKNNRCVLTNLDIVVDVTYTYPKWRGSRNASKETRQAWKEFQKVAVWHEQQHVKITKKFLKDYEKILKQSRSRVSTDCKDLSTFTKIRAGLAITKHERRHKRFDRRDLGKRGKGYKALYKLFKAK